MKLFFKICFLFLIAFNFCGDYFANAVKHKYCIQNDVAYSKKVAPVKVGVKAPVSPVQIANYRGLQKGIDETQVTVSFFHSPLVFSFTDLLKDVDFGQSRFQYFRESTEVFPGSQVHLSSLPLRAPPFSC